MNPAMKFSAKKGDAEIILYGDIGFDITAREFSDELKALGKPGEITLRINSFGGDVFDGVAIYSRLVDSGANITVYVDGIAASAASVIAMAGKEIHIAEAGFVMIHDAWALTAGNAADLIKTAGRLEAVSEQIAGVYQRRTGQDMAQIRKWMAAETEFNASESVEFGFATEVFEAERLAASYNPERHHFKRPPSATLEPRRAEAERLHSIMRMQTFR
jgi:ATP-dependent protease ClpP protease subunit